MLSAIVCAIIFALIPVYIGLVISLINEGKLHTAMGYSAGGSFVGSMIVLTIKQLTQA